MAMNSTVLAADILARWRADPQCGFSADLSDEQLDLLKAHIKAFAEAIIYHIQTNAQVAVASVSGVQVGPGVSGPGAGVIT